VAVFTDTELDLLTGRGGNGEPVRKTPWGEIAWQLGGEKAFASVAQHDAQGIAPGGDVIRQMIPESPCLILVDELLSYISRGREKGAGSQLYNFLHVLSEEARARQNLVLCVSLPASVLEMNPEDQRDYESFSKMLERLGKAITMSADHEMAEIIRRRLFQWEGPSSDSRKTVSAYSEWALDNAGSLNGVEADSVRQLFEASYPFHPSVLSVFERKWQTLPQFQRTRGVLELLALWVAHVFKDQHFKSRYEPLIMLGSAPLDDPTFRSAAFKQLGSDLLTVPVTTDIAGSSTAHAIRLDNDAAPAIKKAQLHQKVATVIFFESNGGQSQSRAEATLAEIKLAVGGPDSNLAEVDTVLEDLMSDCFYLNSDKNRYRFGLNPNLNQVLVNRRGTVQIPAINERIRQTTEAIFNEGSKALTRKYWPTLSNDVPSVDVGRVGAGHGRGQSSDTTIHRIPRS
jgi:predicted AAA+ superfamily ATPase